MKTWLSRYLLAVCLWGVACAAGAAGTADFTLPDLNGQQHRLSDYRGKWVLVNYWATWCPPCREELPELEVFYSQADGDAVVLGVNMEAIDQAELKAFVEEQFLSYPILVAGPNPGPEQRIGAVRGLPTSYLVSPQGEVVARREGAVTADAIRKFIDGYDK
jgi:thiol-disulfide isomerase/thioredoxin